MGTFIKIAWRNIVRNGWRSLITVSAVSIGLGALIFVRAFIEGGLEQMVANYTDLISGHIKISAKGFHRKLGLERSISDPAKIQDIISSNKGIRSFTKRVKEYVLISSDKKSSGVLILGIDPVSEAKVTTIDEKVESGRFLSKGRNNEVLLGKDLCRILRARLGDEIVIMGQGADGSLVADIFILKGIIDSGIEEIDKYAAFITLETAQDLFVMGDKVSEFILRTRDVFNTDVLERDIQGLLDMDKYEVMDWKRISPILLSMINFSTSVVTIILFVVLIVVVAGILNTLLMGVLERIREFGIMLAVGTRKNGIILMMAIESFILGITGAAGGICLGLLLVYYFGNAGIDMTKFGAALQLTYVSPVVYPKIDIGQMIVSTCVVLVSSMLISILPAWKAANLKPIEAIQY